MLVPYETGRLLARSNFNKFVRVDRVSFRKNRCDLCDKSPELNIQTNYQMKHCEVSPILRQAQDWGAQCAQRTMGTWA